VSSPAYKEAEARMAIPPFETRGHTNTNPAGIGFWALLREDFITHERSLLEQGFIALAVHRFGNWRMGLRHKVLRAPCTLLYRFLYKMVEVFCGITLSYVVKVGRRVRIWHHSGIIIGPRFIGDGVHIRQNTTIGVAKTFADDALPIIDSGVDIGSGASILGSVYIGKNAKIGANTVVLTDIPEGGVVMGNPGQLIMQTPAAGSKPPVSAPKPSSKPAARPASVPVQTPKISAAAANVSPDAPPAADAPLIANFGTLAVLGSTNLDYVAMSFRGAAKEMSLDLKVFTPPFGQSRQELLAENSALIQAKPSATLIVERAEDVLGDFYYDPLSIGDSDREAAIVDRIGPWVQTIELARENLTGPIYVMELSVLHRSSLAQADSRQARGVAALIESANKAAAAALAQLPDIRWLPTAEWIAEVGRERSQPGKYWHLGRIPFSNELSNHIARRVLAAMMAQAGMTTRVIVLDLDNTLWGGVLGEDGIENLKIGKSYPGSAFQEFQRTLKSLSRRGIALVIASKNDPDLALKMLNTHPEMILRERDVAGYRINWSEKSQNISDMLEEMSLGPKSCLFLDDNPVEREKVRRNVPGVVVPDMPTDPAEFSAWLLNLPCVECVSLTSSDLKRSDQYRKRAVTNASRRTFANIEDFYRDLGMKVRFEPFSPQNQERTLQLLVKTNQFNTTTARHDAAAIRRILDAGGEVYAVGVEDRNSSYELMGVVILAGGPEGEAVIDSFLLSCRTLGRTVETAMLAFLCRRAKARGAAAITGDIVPTERNTPVRDLYSRHGFEAAENRFRLPLDRAVAMPEYFTVLE
jgi:FkbH-like protein